MTRRDAASARPGRRLTRSGAASAALVVAVIVVALGAAVGTRSSPSSAAVTGTGSGSGSGATSGTGATETGPDAAQRASASASSGAASLPHTAGAAATGSSVANQPAPGASGTCASLLPGTHRLPSIDGRIPVVLHIGKTAKPGAALILGLPGAGQTARDFASYTQYSRLADRDGFSVAYPTATGARPFWNISGTQAGKPDDLAYLREVIPIVVRAACASPRRVGVTGVSNGGGMSARLACDASDLVAAAAPVAGGYGSLPDCHPKRPVPILEVHSLTDRVVPYRGTGSGASGAVGAFLTQWRSIDRCRGKAHTTRPYDDIVEQRWTACASGTAVQHDRVADQDHGWPGQGDLDGDDEFSSTRATWQFLSRFRLPAA